MFNFEDLLKKSKTISSNSYGKRIELLKATGRETLHIESTVDAANKNIADGKKSYVIYGEPQSGKTELMIALTAKLLDEGYKYVIILMNDSVALLNQNLTRFKKAGLSTVPVSYRELLDSSVNIKSRSRVIFSKKNAADLRKLTELTRNLKDVVVIDDEADYATPNSKINKQEVSKINELTGLLIKDGIYIGVTATPARLDLNYTHMNESTDWVDFPHHSNYTGQDIFFPTDITQTSRFSLKLLPDENDSPKYLREAVYRFLVNSAYLNLVKKPRNYTMLIHTSGKKEDHNQDFDYVNSLIKILSDPSDEKRVKHYEEIWNIANKMYQLEADRIVEFIISQIESVYMMIMNSDHENDSTVAGNPPSPFTIIIGGNSISRGVTFDNLLSMFFTRDSKHNIQQDTYIQRARMFGSREDILKYFELSIPRKLYADWRRAFIFHRLSLESRKNGDGAPVWHEGMRIKVAASSSVDSSRVTFDKGEMSFKKFEYTNVIKSIFLSPDTDMKKVERLLSSLPSGSFPEYLVQFIKAFSGNDEKSIVVHSPRSIMGMDPAYANYDDISRDRGLVAGKDLVSKLKPDASHHIFVFSNDKGQGRIVYKFNENISFIKGHS